jgi:hypothetical protein
MANQITIDIVAQTQKLTSGINDANSQIDGMSSKLKGAAAAAGAAASAFVLKQGVTFLKQGIDEAKEAQETMTAATTTFGQGSAALAKITEDADKFGKAIAVDNDVLIQLSTQLGSRLPADAKALSAEIINTAFDIQAYTAGAVTAEAVSAKLAKAFVDGELSAKELAKIFPDLSDAVYAQAEAASKAGDNQKALDIIIEAAQAKYGDAAEKNVTSTQRFETALANFKETLGTKVLPILEKGIDFLTKMIEVFDGLPGPVQNIILGLTGIVAIGGPLLTFLASAKTAMQVLNITTMAFPGMWVIGIITLVIAAIVLLVKNWDTVTEVLGKVWTAIKDFTSKAWESLKSFTSKVTNFIGDIIDAFKSIPGNMLNIGKDLVTGLWSGIQSMSSWLKNRVFDFFGNLVPGWAKKMLGISSPSKVFASFGKDIVRGLAGGIDNSRGIATNSITGLVNTVIDSFGVNNFVTTSDLIDAISTASVDQAALAGTGLDWDAVNQQFNIDDTVVTTAKLSELMNSSFYIPSLNAADPTGTVYNITVNAGAGTDPYSVGRAVTSAIDKYSRISSTPNQRVTL